MATAAPFPLTTFELHALLSLREGPAAARSAQSLRLDTTGDAAAVSRRAGLASLLVRDLATISDGIITAQGNAGGVAGALTRGDRWVEIGIVRPSSTDAAVLVGTGIGGVMITPRGFDVWNVLPIGEGRDLVDAGVALARQGVEASAENAAVAASVKVSTVDSTRAASAHRDDDGTWKIATEPADAEGRLTVQEGTYPDLDAAFAALREALS
ncbi:hypothetical protein [Cellulosimicrobium arenosum]|uniref:Uncharacterized protein n=1 Tax=Cellulosimicrobium arenosum TaxID=2708133 RepID=A0A927IZI8_9MICO|nr:hypothetical protein [Cellulosimicrobium arenosum]MBD8078623.1 hypothetical protein [Cellulosimicrobium arenosum]